jgi:hypothetical protein
MKTYGNVILMATICVVIFWVFMALRPAAASWRLIPGKAYDGHIAVRSYREPCWSAAKSKCSLERSGHKWAPHG